MVDTRFHRFSGPIAVGALLSELGHADLAVGLANAGKLIGGVSELDLAGPDDLVLAAHATYAEELSRTSAGFAIISAAVKDRVPAGVQAIVAPQAHVLFAQILDRLYPDSTRNIIAGGRSDLGAPVFERDVTILSLIHI